MGIARTALAAGVLLLGLGCAGLEEAGKQAMDADLDVKQGADAKLPDDFPLPAPDGGTLASVVSAGLLGTHTLSAVYELPAGTDVDAALAPYEQLMKDHGMNVSSQTSDATRVLSGVKDQTTWTLTVTPDEGKVMMTLTVANVGT